LLSLEQLRQEPLFGDQYDAVRARYPDLDDRRLLYEIIRRMINRLVTDLIENTERSLDELKPASIETVRQQPQPLVRFSAEVYEQHLRLKRFLYENLYRHDKVRVMTERAKERVRDLFNRYFESPAQMAPDFSAPATAAAGEQVRARVVADYIAGMTDRYAIAEHERLLAKAPPLP
jgi:dGTPase